MVLLNDKISIRQLQILLILDIFGVGITFLPRTVAEFSGQDGWMCVIIATIAVSVFAYIISTLAGMFPNETFVDYSSKLLSRPIGILLSVGFVIKMTVTAAIQLRFFGEIVKQIMLKSTPFAVICGLMVLISAYSAAKGYEGRARLSQILVFIVFLPLIFVCLVASRDADFSNLLPVAVTNRTNLLNGSYSAILAFSGIDFCLLVFPYLNRPKNARRGIVQTVALIGGLMTVITVVAIAKFGASDLKLVMWPVLDMMDTIDLPGSLLEHQGALIMSFWIVSVFAIVNACVFFSSLLLRDVCKKGTHLTYIIIIVPIIFLLSFLPPNTVIAFQMFNWLNYTFGIAFLIVIPLVLLLVAKLRRIGGGHRD